MISFIDAMTPIAAMARPSGIGTNRSIRKCRLAAVRPKSGQALFSTINTFMPLAPAMPVRSIEFENKDFKNLDSPFLANFEMPMHALSIASTDEFQQFIFPRNHFA